MLNKNIIYALSSCKEILIKELKEELERTSGGKVDIDVTIFTENPYPELDSDYMPNIITSVSLKDNRVIVRYEDYLKQYEDPIDLFTVDEISKIVDAI